MRFNDNSDIYFPMHEVVSEMSNDVLVGADILNALPKAIKCLDSSQASLITEFIRNLETDSDMMDDQNLRRDILGIAADINSLAMKNCGRCLNSDCKYRDEEKK